MENDAAEAVYKFVFTTDDSSEFYTYFGFKVQTFIPEFYVG
jgi:hypothetical protein